MLPPDGRGEQGSKIMYRRINTMAGVVALDQAAGVVEVGKPDPTDTIIDLIVTDSTGLPARVYLDRAMALELMAAIGANVVDL